MRQRRGERRARGGPFELSGKLFELSDELFELSGKLFQLVYVPCCFSQAAPAPEEQVAETDEMRVLRQRLLAAANDGERQQIMSAAAAASTPEEARLSCQESCLSCQESCLSCQESCLSCQESCFNLFMFPLFLTGRRRAFWAYHHSLREWLSPSRASQRYRWYHRQPFAGHSDVGLWSF
jgi:hypothetical protein